MEVVLDHRRIIQERAQVEIGAAGSRDIAQARHVRRLTRRNALLYCGLRLHVQTDSDIRIFGFKAVQQIAHHGAVDAVLRPRERNLNDFLCCDARRN